MISLLKLFNPETAHNIAKWAMKRRLFAPGRRDSVFGPLVFAHRIANPLGLAAGFDKNGELVDVIEDYGFGFIEVGSVTLLGGQGNPKPRMFRLENGDIMNRMGLNGDPAEVVAGRLEKAKSRAYGVNIAKTHSPYIMGDAAIDDIVRSYRLLKNFGMYTAINVSCPNTKEGKTFESPEPLGELLSALWRERDEHSRPILVKFSPGLADNLDLFRQLLGVCEIVGVEGYILSNTTPFEHPKYGKGGRSGSFVAVNARVLVRTARNELGSKPMIIGCGGIRDTLDVIAMRDCGANLFQVYNGFVSGPMAGPYFAHDLDV